MENLFYLPSQFMPKVNTQAYKLLAAIADGHKHDKQELMVVLDDDPRSPLQALRGEKHGFWVIHNVGSTKGVYQLDECHLSGDRDIDQQVRVQAELKFLKCSRQLAERETMRLPKAAKSLAQESFNFSESNRKPTED